MAIRSAVVGVPRREPCAKCRLPVFIAERLTIGKQTFHRTCFRCARCSGQLTLANYYETETNQYCCETCPDEEAVAVVSTTPEQVVPRSLSDEEKSAAAGLASDEYSAMFETALEYPELSSNSDYTRARSQFISTMLLDDEEEPPDDSSLPRVNISDSSDIVTKENVQANTSLVQARMRLFQRMDEDTSGVDYLVQDDEQSARSKENKPRIVNESPFTITDTSIIVISDDSMLDQKSASLYDSNLVESEFLESSEKRFSSEIDEKIVNISDEANSNKLAGLNDDVRENSMVGVKHNSDIIEINSEETSRTCRNEVEKKRVNFSDGVTENKETSRSAYEEARRCNYEEEITPGSDFENRANRGDEFEEEIIVTEASKIINADVKISDNDDSKSISNNEDVKTTRHKEDIKATCDNEGIKSTCDNEDISALCHNEDASGISSNEDLKSARTNEYSELNDGEIEDEIKTDGVENSIETEIVEANIKTERLEDNIKVEGNMSINISCKDPEESSTTTKIVDSIVFIKKPLVGSTEKTKSDFEDVHYPTDLNPFGDEDGEEIACAETKKRLIPAHRMSLKTPKAYDKYLNPFSDDEDEDEVVAETEATKSSMLVGDVTNDSLTSSDSAESRKRIIHAPKLSLNPFWSDDEDNEDRKPVATPRSNKRNNNHPQARASTTPLFGSSTSISSGTSSVHSTRKKKPAPRPPIPLFDSQNSPRKTEAASPSASATHSPKPRKTKRAPLPPTSTPAINRELLFNNLSPISDTSTLKNTCTSSVFTKTTNVEPHHCTQSPVGSVESIEFEKEKVAKDEVNRNRQSQSNLSPVDIKPVQITTPNKSTYGKWKRKKGQAPTRPVVQKRTIRALPMVEVKRQFDIIEIQLQGLERQGVRLEEIIRERCEGPETDPNSALSIESEDLILQLFEVVNEKNELCRQKAELMYLQRQHRLEEEHAEVEYQIRCLMQQPEVNKTDSDKAREEALITKLVDIVERRNEIIECLEMDRLRETEEDDSICNSLNSYASKRDDSSETASPKKKEKKKFRKKFKLRGSHKVDMDKDVDESESSNSSTLSKDKKKKKFNLF